MSSQRSFIRNWKLITRSAAVVGTLLTTALVLLGGISSSAVEPLNALVPTTVEVPLALRDFPFNHDRVLKVPPEFKISVVARIPGARFIMPLSTGEILVAQPGLGSIFLVRPQAKGTAAVSALIEDLRNPQGMALHSSDDRLYLYVGESNQVSRYLIAPGAANAAEKTVIVPNLPDSSSPELHGPYRHELKNLVIGPDNKLYVDIASLRMQILKIPLAILFAVRSSSMTSMARMGKSSPAGSAMPRDSRLSRVLMSFGQQSTKRMTFAIRSETAGRVADQSIPYSRRLDTAKDRSNAKRFPGLELLQVMKR